jgi:sigma-B regulation protein RsbU (phosphoserine phosphatase)
MEAIATSIVRDQLIERRARLASVPTAASSADLRRLLDEVDAVLWRLDGGTYGACEECHEPIEAERLLADPLVRFCLDHLPPAEQRALEQDLQLAARIQRGLLPDPDLAMPGWTAAYHYQPVRLVSGDYCDLIVANDGVLHFLLGDVSGKGAAAALYAAMAIGMLRNLAQPGQPPTMLLEEANKLLFERKVGSRYLTAMYAKWFPRERRLIIANAGQPRPILLRGDTIEDLAVVGIPLGLLEGSSYEHLDVRLQPGDLLVLVSDGITETTNEARHQYGEERLKTVIRKNHTASASELLRIIFDDVQKFAAGGVQDDDRTIIVAKVTS